MNWFRRNPREFDRELLAAYADGELEGREELAQLRLQVETWLETHPEAHRELHEYRSLRELLEATPPPDQEEGVWEEMAHRLRVTRFRTEVPNRPNQRWFVAGLAGAVAAGLAWAMFSVPAHLENPQAKMTNARPGSANNLEPFPVAGVGEVEILSVSGDSALALVVGELPLHGPMKLAGPGEVTVTSVQPAAHDNMLPVFRADGNPMIWSRLDSEP